MAFESLSDKLNGIFKNMKNKGSLTEKDIDATMREVKLALLEADVNFKVVKEFVANVKEKAMTTFTILKRRISASMSTKRRRRYTEPQRKAAI